MKRDVLAAILFLTASTAFGQFTSSIQVGYTHDSNVFGNFAEVPDNYLTFNLNLENYVGWDYSSLDLSYNGGLSSYGAYPEQDNWNHLVNASYKIQLSRYADDMDSTESDQPAAENSSALPIDSLETYLSFTGFMNRTVPHSGDFAAYTNYTTAAMAGFRYTFLQDVILHLYYAVNYTGYDQITSLSNLENSGSAVMSFMPSSGFALYLDGSIGTKKYYAVDTISSAVKKLINMHSQGIYRGKGKGKSSTQPGTTAAKTYVLDSPSAAEATYGAGINVCSGMWKGNAALLLRRDVSGSARYINAVAKLAAAASEVYDDPYSYHGSEFHIGFSNDSLGAGFGLAAGFNTAKKDYNRPAFDTSQTVIVAKERRDNYRDFSVAITKSFTSSGFPSGYMLGLNYDHLWNSSNDQYYNFNDDVVALTLTINLF